MDQLIINGDIPLKGTIGVSGAKNAALAILPAAILANNTSVIENLPNIEDIANLIGLLEGLGAKCTKTDNNTLTIDATNVNSHSATYEEAKKIRASYYLLGAMLGRFKKARVAMPGGCNFGARPVDQHIKGFEALGAKVEMKHGMIDMHADVLKGATIFLDVVSVGATINIMLAAVLAEGITTIENAAREPHVVDTANFLNMMGAKIKGAGTDVIRITGVENLSGGTHTIIPDQIEAGTYMIAAAITGGDVTIENVIPRHMDPLTAKLSEMKCVIEEGDDWIRVCANKKDLIATNIKTMVYPGFPTDLQPQITALLSIANGTSIVTENVWDSRFQYINEAKRLGCDVTVEGKIAVIGGASELTGAEVNATDLRAGAALVVLGLAAKGTTKVGGAKHVDRGYEDVVGKLKALGADISRATK